MDHLIFPLCKSGVQVICFSITTGFFLQVFWSFRVTFVWLLWYSDHSFLLLKCIWEQQRCPFSPMHNLRLHLQKTDLHKKDSLHDINAARHQSLCKVPHFKNHPTNQQFLKFGLNYMHWALWKVRPDLCWMCTLIKHRECGVLTILCSVKMYLCW